MHGLASWLSHDGCCESGDGAPGQPYLVAFDDREKLASVPHHPHQLTPTHPELKGAEQPTSTGAAATWRRTLYPMSNFQDVCSQMSCLREAAIARHRLEVGLLFQEVQHLLDVLCLMDMQDMPRKWCQGIRPGE